MLAMDSSDSSLIDPGIVGTFEDNKENASLAAVVSRGNTLLGHGLGFNDGIYKTNPTTDYSETFELGLADAIRIDGPSFGPLNPHTPGPDYYTFDNTLGYEYAIGKYNGPNAGYVMFALSPDSFTTVSIPGTSDSIWTNKRGRGYELSNVTLVTPIPEPSSNITLGTPVPEPSTAIALGGLLFLSLGLRERRQPQVGDLRD